MTDHNASPNQETSSTDTLPLMSWAAIQFVQRPSSRVLRGVVACIIGLSVAVVASTNFISVDVVINAYGEIVANPAMVQIVSPVEGFISSLKHQPGDHVTKGEILGSLQMDLSETEVEQVLQRLHANVALIKEATQRRGIPEGVEIGTSLSALQDGAIPDYAASLQAAWRDFEQSFSGQGDYERNKNNVIRVNELLEGKLSAYLEHHRIRATDDGTLQAMHATVNSSVHSGSIIALILPAGASLVAWVEVSSKDIPNIHPGESVVHTLEAFSFSRFGGFKGEVLNVEQVIAEPNSGRSLRYFVRASIQPPQNVQLALSMQVHSRIITGRKKLKDLILEKWFGWTT